MKWIAFAAVIVVVGTIGGTVTAQHEGHGFAPGALEVTPRAGIVFQGPKDWKLPKEVLPWPKDAPPPTFSNADVKWKKYEYVDPKSDARICIACSGSWCIDCWE